MALTLREKLKSLRQKLEHEYLDSRKEVIRQEIGIIQEQLASERRTMGERQETLWL